MQLSASLIDKYAAPFDNANIAKHVGKIKNAVNNQNGDIKKRIILKVSDFRSALIQAKFLAKKGIWVSEFRIESGLNCGGRAFATEGYLLGPILEEFKQKRAEMAEELFSLYQPALLAKQITIANIPQQKISCLAFIGKKAITLNNKSHSFSSGFYVGCP